jgi:hypothetical protein
VLAEGTLVQIVAHNETGERDVWVGGVVTCTIFQGYS